MGYILKKLVQANNKTQHVGRKKNESIQVQSSKGSQKFFWDYNYKILPNKSKVQKHIALQRLPSLQPTRSPPRWFPRWFKPRWALDTGDCEPLEVACLVFRWIKHHHHTTGEPSYQKIQKKHRIYIDHYRLLHRSFTLFNPHSTHAISSVHHSLLSYEPEGQPSL